MHIRLTYSHECQCSEERPTCSPCKRNSLRCVYPYTREELSSPAPQLVAPQVQSMKDLHYGNLEYTALDLRFLHQFLTYGYPHLPVDSAHVWTHDVPAMAHEVPLTVPLWAPTHVS